MNRILYRIAKTLLIEKIFYDYNKEENDQLTSKELYDERARYDSLTYDPECGRILTFDDGTHQTAKFAYRKWTEDMDEANSHIDLLNEILKEFHLPLIKDWQDATDYNKNLKLGFVTTWKNNAFIIPKYCYNTSIYEVKSLILKFCPNIKYVYNYNVFDESKSDNYDVIKSM